MRRYVLSLLLMVSVAACEGTIETALDGESVHDVATGVGVPTDPQSVADGAELYALYCETCHGPDAGGGATWPSPIQGYEPIADIVATGRGTMAAIPITREETNLIQAYLLSLGLPDWSSLSGPEVFAVGCASCHGTEAEGSDRGPQLRFRDSAYFSYVTRHGGRADRFDSEMAAYGEDRITDAQLTDMISWIDSFANASDGQGLFHQFCANCHGDATIPARTNEDVDEGSIVEVCRSGKEDSVSNREYMPGWSEAEITDAELAEIQAYIDGR